MKGMLTGPVTILNWSFPRADVSREIQCKQLSLALRDEVIDLEKAGIKAVQVDEPALREGVSVIHVLLLNVFAHSLSQLPLRKADWDEYLGWSVSSFKLATAGVTDALQTHSHFCYSDFDDIFPSIQALDADVISIEASKSDLKLLKTFKAYSYSNQIGPGVYDIHSPRVPGEQEIKDRIAAMLETLPADLVVINPVRVILCTFLDCLNDLLIFSQDCGLKTRGWKETEGEFSSSCDHVILVLTLPL